MSHNKFLNPAVFHVLGIVMPKQKEEQEPVDLSDWIAQSEELQEGEFLSLAAGQEIDVIFRDVKTAEFKYVKDESPEFQEEWHLQPVTTFTFQVDGIEKEFQRPLQKQVVTMLLRHLTGKAPGYKFTLARETGNMGRYYIMV